ncbi:uncharacterized protein [Amphiura filiformis]|uniref:uncharacterized protein isoform X2 n=1 Tax=Amphiura filiformis TaxID=82378 RepID=UPI003B2185B0
MAAGSGCLRRSCKNLTIIFLFLFLHEAACTLIANCSTSGCSNGGTCIHTPDSYIYNCACSSGWTGSLCKTSTSFPSAPCSGSPCLNGGSCQTLLGKSMCICVDPWQGANCEIRDAVPVGIDCGSYESKCANGACISRFLWCDGGRDCIDGSDEKDCSGSSLDVLDGCKPWHFNCGDGANCVSVESRCNKVKDCDNGADEYGCDLTGSMSGQCGRLEFRCEDGRCIMGRARCDGNPDCRDGSDEKNCASIVQNPPCSVWDFDCGDGSCVDRRGRCDRYPDCQNEADEANCDTAQPKLPSEEQLMPATPIHTNGNSLNLVDILIVSCAMLMAFVAITIFVYLRRVRRMHQRYFAAVGGTPPTATTSAPRHRHYRRQQGTPYRLSHHSTFCHHLPPHRCPASSNLLVSYNLHTGAEVVGRGATADKDDTDCGDEVPPAYAEVVGASGTWTREGSETPPPAYEDLPSAFRH